MRYPEAAAFIGIPVGTLRAMVSRKQVPYIRLGPRLVVFDQRAIEEWLQSKTVKEKTSEDRATRVRGQGRSRAT
jgi:excisionase family DNA binding protein